MMSVTTDVQEFVEKTIKGTLVKGFYSTYIQKNVEASLKEVEKELDQIVSEGILKKYYELCCNENFCTHQLDGQEDPSNFKEEYDCERCGEEIEDISSCVTKVRYMAVR